MGTMVYDSGLANILAFVLVFGIYFLFAKPLAKLHSFPDPGVGRFGTIDGLRGILALAVFVHHFAATTIYRYSGSWNWTPSRLLNLCAQIGVSLFFMITGFLFWGKLIQSEGRLNWVQLFVSRFFRLAPLYWVIAAFVVFYATWQTQFNVQGHLRNYFEEVLTWILFQQSVVNGYTNTWMIIAGVNWTLIYEWCFYLSLPLLAIAWTMGRRSRALKWTLLVIAFLIPFIPSPLFTPKIDNFFFLFFVLGAVAFRLGQVLGVRAFFQNPFSSIIPLAALTALCVLYKEAYGVPQALLLFGIFAPISWGCSLFGLLNTKPIRFLGEISYSIYLLHGALLFVTFDQLFPDFFKTVRTFWEFWGVLAILGLVLIFLASLTYRYIELPFIRIGKGVGLYLQPKEPGTLDRPQGSNP